jgi:hypothetical protein
MQKLLDTLSGHQLEDANARKPIRSSRKIDTYAQGLAVGYQGLERDEDTPPSKRRRVQRMHPEVESHGLLQQLIANSFSLARAEYSESLEGLSNAIS